MDNKKEKNASIIRLKEMMSVLKTHNIIKGITPEKVRLILEDMGPTYVKLGQVMSMRADILPQKYCDELIKLRANAKPMPFELVEEILKREYSQNLDKIFLHIDEKPLGSASMAQVHLAVLKTGEEVVVKVQRPGIREIMKKDISLMKKAIKIFSNINEISNLADFESIIDELWVVAQEEMDFMLEASNLNQFAKCNIDIKYVRCPKVNMPLTTQHVLVMEKINGIQIDKVDELKKLGYDVDEIAKNLAENYAKQILDDSFFHADPHPGNIWIEDGKIVWLDLGMVGRLSARDKNLFTQAITAIINNDIFELKRVVLALGDIRGTINHSRLYSDLDVMVNKYATLELVDIHLGKFMQELLEIAKNNYISMPADLSMLARGVLTIEGVLSACSPNTNFLTIVKSHIFSNSKNKIDIEKELYNIKKSLHSLFNKGINIPAQLSDVLKMTAQGQTKVNLELTGSEEPLRRIDKMVNRLINCILSAGLLLASSTICTTQMQPQFMGIPILGAIGYLVAIILGIGLIIDIRRSKNK